MNSDNFDFHEIMFLAAQKRDSFSWQVAFQCMRSSHIRDG